LPESVIVIASWPSIDLRVEADTLIYTADVPVAITTLILRHVASSAVTVWPEVSAGVDEDAGNVTAPMPVIGVLAAGDSFIIPVMSKSVEMGAEDELSVRVISGAVATALEISIDIIGYVIAS
jgi:hypothetical protein